MDTNNTLANIILTLDNIKDINRLKCVNREIANLMQSSTFINYIHKEKNGATAPKVVYTPEETTWRLEFSFFPQRYFFKVGEKIFFKYALLWRYALVNKDKWIVAFLESLFPSLRELDFKKETILKPLDVQLTKEQIEYVNSVVDIGEKDCLGDYIDNLADYGDMDYFEEMLKEKEISLYTMVDSPYRDKSRITFTQRFIDREILYGYIVRNTENSPKITVAQRFVNRMVVYGKKDLLKSYIRYVDWNPKLNILNPKKYHPDQRNIPDVDTSFLNLIRIKSPHKLYTHVKERNMHVSHEILAYLANFPGYIPWLIKEHPDEVKIIYQEDGNIDVVMNRGEIFRDEICPDFLKSYEQSNYTWKDISYLFDSVLLMRKLIILIALTSNLELFPEIYNANPDETKEEFLNWLRQVNQGNGNIITNDLAVAVVKEILKE